MAITKAVSSKAGIGTAIDYVTREEKTEEKLMSGIGCTPQTAKEEMQATKELWGKKGGREYKHFTISYAPEEKITTEQAHKNAKELIENTPALKGYECLVATHKDKKHIHTHIIVNSVSYEDGYKLQWNKHDLADLKERTNEQSRQQGLHVPEKGKHYDGSRNDDVTTWSKDKQKALEKAFSGDYKSYLLDVANAVAEVRQSAGSRTEFVEQMKSKGIETEWKDNHKHITFKTAEGQKVRNSNLTKTFKADFGKESLEDEFQRNAERNRTTERARQQLQSGTDKEPEREDRKVDTGAIDQAIQNRRIGAVDIEIERRERELAKVKQERERAERDKQKSLIKAESERGGEKKTVHHSRGMSR